jgi:rod shape-determining protein MreC
MDYGPPPLFNQGIPARARLAFFALLSVTLIVVDARVKALETIRTGVGVVLYPLQQAMLLPGAAVGRIGEYVTSVASLARENETLRREAFERAQLLLQAEQLRAENAQLRRLGELRERAGHGALLAEVLYESRDPFTRKIVLDRGANDGLRVGHPVIDPAGVVGQVTRVFPLTSEVTLLTDKDMAIPVQVLRNGLRGIAFGGAEPGTLDLRFMATNADIHQGDVLVTSGIDGVYPPGLPVATVGRVERNVREQFARIVLLPAGAVQSNRHLLVLQTDPSQLAPRPPLEERSRPRDARRSGKAGAPAEAGGRAAPGGERP